MNMIKKYLGIHIIEWIDSYGVTHTQSIPTRPLAYLVEFLYRKWYDIEEN